ncbi:helix-turn-helix domain-containing protein [Neobacillus sp. NPDC093182]|uniref:helix-turn-helix domain-containing protein n=1 Tax=Neobacillus sp. NPDC093182 TaxID=3364297 RepID=UPI003821CDE3
MAKFSTEDKFAAVQCYLQGNDSYRTIGASIGAHSSLVKTWVKQYEKNGVEAFQKSYTSLSTEFKLNVLKYMNDYGTSPNETGAIFKIADPSTIRKWRRQLEEHGIDALKSKKKGRPSMKKDTTKTETQKPKTNQPIPGQESVEALQSKVERLEMEIAYLKKLNALVQMQEKLQTKSKRK